MNKTVMKGKWHQTRGAVRQRWGKLTNDDVTMFLGGGEQLVGKLQERYGYTREQAQAEVDDFLENLGDLPVPEEPERALETAREHPWFTSLFFGAIVLLISGYLLNRRYNIVEIQEEFRAPVS
jgi:uncharacterized protein YjbJ (UPF0337 family)